MNNYTPIPHTAPTEDQSVFADLRTKIDALDTQIVALLNQRTLIVQQIGDLKKREGLPIYSPTREAQLLHQLIEQNKGPLSAEAIRAIYREILSASRSVEKEIVIACLGAAGGASHQAASSRFGSSIKYVFTKETSDIFRQISENEADYGIVPMDTPEQGLGEDSLYDLTKTDLYVCAEIVLGNQDNEGKMPSYFLVLGRTLNPPSGFDHTLIALRVEDKSGALVDALEPFKKFANNLHRIISRPASKGSNDIFFFVEAEGHFRDLQTNILRNLSKHCRAVKVLGSYPKQPAGN